MSRIGSSSGFRKRTEKRNITVNITGKKKKVWNVLTSLPLEYALTVERIAISRGITCKEAFLLCVYTGIEAQRRQLPIETQMDVKGEVSKKSAFDDW
jgi:hypothetical protein